MKAIVFAALLAALYTGAAPEAVAQMKDRGGMSPKDHGGTGMPMQGAQAHKANGLVNTVDAERGMVNVTHGPIPSLKWPQMTMDFEVADKTMLEGLKPGMKVEFELGKKKAGGYAITSIRQAR